MFPNLGFNLILPILILNKGERWLGGLLQDFLRICRWRPADRGVLSGPLFHLRLFQTQQNQPVAALGLLSVLLTGLFGVLKLPVEWFPVKEASIPLVLGIGVIASNFTRNSFFKALIMNPEICDVPRIETALREHRSEDAFALLIRKCNWLMAASFLISSVLNYVIADWLVTSPTGTEAFNAEVANMRRVSWVAIALPAWH